MMKVFAGILIAFILTSCNNDTNAPDVSHIKVDFTINRFDNDFFSIDTNQLNTSIQTLQKKYPSFLPIYFEYFSPIDYIAKQEGQSYAAAITEYYRNIKPLHDSVKKKISNLKNVEEELEKNFRYVKYYYPAIKTPAVLTSVESLNPENPLEIYGTTYYHDTLIISLQMFLGKDFSIYDPTHYPDYIRRRFNPEFIVPNCFRAIANDIYTESSEGAPLIEQMIEKGKQWYLLKKFLPNTEDSLITGYASRQMEWVKNNEGNIWGEINKKEDLYSIEQLTVQTYIGEAPFTQTLPYSTDGAGAPGNIGPWIGWKIIENFTANNPKLTLQQVLKTPAKKIFQQAKYRPK